MDLSDFVVETIQIDAKSTLGRAVARDGLSSRLILIPDGADDEALQSLDRELAFRDRLGEPWAALPIRTLTHGGRRVLMLEDPGGSPIKVDPDDPIDIVAFLSVASAIAAALKAAHRQGLIHRDVRPTNVLYGEAGTARLIRWANAALSDAPSSGPRPRTDRFIGTFAYMSPEQTGRTGRGVDRRSDIYSLGVALYEILTGRLPFSASEPAGWLLCHTSKDPRPISDWRSDVPAVVEAIIMKMLAKDPDARYQSAAGAESDLLRCLADLRQFGEVRLPALGADDAAELITGPFRLHGRDGELEILDGFLRQASRGQAEKMLVVSGPSGIGKTALVDTFCTDVLRSEHMLVTTKADQYKRHIPYSMLSAVFGQLARQVLAAPDDVLADWRRRLEKALGANVQIVAQLIPEFAVLLGARDVTSNPLPLERQNRVMQAIRGLFEVFTTAELPLVLVLDDLQWVDDSSIEMMAAICRSESLRRMLVIGTYRSEDIGSNPALDHFVRAARRDDLIREVELAPLSRDALNALIADNLGRDPTESLELADTIGDKTGSNPFFALRYVSTLKDQNLISTASDGHRWVWDLDHIRQQTIAENVAVLMGRQLRQLDGATREALATLACIGFSANLSVLTKVRRRSETDCIQELSEAVRAGLLIQSTGEYRFVHDRVHESAYALLEPAERQACHRAIACALRESGTDDEQLFELTGHYNASLALLQTPEERLDVARFNLRAAKKAKDGAAYRSAMQLIDVARSLMEDGHAAESEALLFRLDLLKAECLLLTGQIDAGDTLLVALTGRCSSTLEYADVCCLRTDVCIMRSDNAKGVQLALECLERFGLRLSRKPDRAQFDEAFARAWSALDGRDIASLSTLPTLPPGEVEAILRVLQALFTPAAFQDARLFHINLCWIVERVINNGITESSCSALGWFGVMLGHVLGKYDEGYQFGSLACEIARTRGYLAQEAKCLLTLEVVTLWRRPVSEAVGILDVGIAAAARSGDVISYSFLQSHRILDLIMRGDPLTVVQSEIEDAFRFTRSIRFRDSFDVNLDYHLLVRCLVGSDQPFAMFDGSEFSSQKFEDELVDTRNHMIILFYWIMKGVVCYFSDQFEDALRHFDKAQQFRLCASGHIQLLFLEFYAALSSAALCQRQTSCHDRAGHRARILANLAVIDAWVENCPETFLDKSALVRAELARIDGQDSVAAELYESAISAANAGGSAHFQAVAYEVAGRYFRTRQLPTAAAAFLAKARQCYKLWGATGKLARFDQQYPEVRIESGEPRNVAHDVSTLGDLDTATIVQVSQAISSEIDLRKLITCLLHLALEQSGGDRAALVWVVDGLPRLEAEGFLAEGTVSVAFSGASLDEAPLPRAAIRYVLRTAETMLVDDVAHATSIDLHGLPADSSCRSFVCVALVRSKSCVGVLYIEHSKLTGAFAEQGLGILNLLGAQAAISLENARLYGELTAAFERGREAETELRLALDSVPALVWNIRPDGTEAVFNKRWHDYTGFTAERARNGGWIEAFHPEDREKNVTLWSRMLVTGEPGELEARVLRHDGKVRSFLVRASPLRDGNGRIIKWYGSHTDIETLIRAERLAVEEKRLVELVTSSSTLDEIMESICRSVESLLPATRAEISVGDWKAISRDHQPGRSERPPAELPARSEGDPRSCHRSTIRLLDGREIGHLTVASDTDLVLEDEDASLSDQFARIAGIIIERRLADSALRQNQALLEYGERIAGTGSWAWDLSDDVVSLSAECSRILGFEPAQREVSASGFLSRILAQEAESVQRHIRDAVAGKVGFGLEHGIELPGGAVRYVHDQGRYEPKTHLASPHYIGTISDITERRNNEEQVRRLVSLVENSQDCIGYADVSGRVLYLNDAWLNLAGLSGSTFGRYQLADLFVTDDSSSAIMQQLQQKGHAEGENTLVNKSTGRTIPVYQKKFYTVDTTTGVRTGIGTICRDISDEKRLTTNLQASLREKDALLKEVHHRVKNNLQLISSLLNLQAARIADSDVAELFAESRNRVRAMALVHENLYRAGNFARLAMPEHIEILCSHLARVYDLKGADVRIATAVEDVKLSLDSAISVGLIINELVSNAMKHAFPAKRGGNVAVALRDDGEDAFVLRIEDDGIGLPWDAYSSASTLGMQLVRDLTDQLGGKLAIDVTRGTRFTIRFSGGAPLA